MKYDFDSLIERRGTGSIKYDCAAERGKSEDLLPLWVADMDFALPPEIIEVLEARVAHSIFGYSTPCSGYFESIQTWYRLRHQWTPEEAWLVKTPGVVFALATAVRAYTQSGQGVLIQTPVYYPFKGVIESNNRRVVRAPLIYEDGRYSIDFDAFEAAIVDNKVRLFLFCSPHNPVGRVWTKDELERLGAICLKHRVVVVSDEIHADFVYPEHQHTVFSQIMPELAELSVICTSPGKTFNLASLQIGNIFIPNPTLRAAFIKAVHETGYSQFNSMGLVATQACYENGEEWVNQLTHYLAGNLAFVQSFLQDKLPQLRLVELQGTYLAWIDCKALQLDDRELLRLVEDDAGLWVDEGTMFGEEGSGFIRINIACPRALLERAFTQLEAAISKCS